MKVVVIIKKDKRGDNCLRITEEAWKEAEKAYVESGYRLATRDEVKLHFPELLNGMKAEKPKASKPVDLNPPIPPEKK